MSSIKEKNWQCNSHFLPIGTWKNPFFLNDTIFLRLRSFSESKLEIQTSRRNSLILPNMLINSKFTFANNEQVSISFKVNSVEEYDDYSVLIKAEPVGLDKNTRFALGSYLAEFDKTTSYDEILESGFYIRNFVEKISFETSTIKDTEKFEEIVELRSSGYNTDAELLKDSWDERAIFITARWQGRAIATLRLVYHFDGKTFEQEDHCERNGNFPEDKKTVEVTRITIAKGFRSSGIMQHLLTEATMHILTSGRKWLLGSTPNRLLKLYYSAGATSTKSTYEMTDHAKPVKLTIIKADIPHIFSGGNVGPLSWNAIYKKGADFLIKCDVYKPSLYERSRMYFYSFFYSITEYLTESSMVKAADKKR